MNLKAEKYRSYLIDNVMPFWLNYGLDKENGGFFTCLDRKGELFSEDKSVWFQGRGTWIFSKLYNDVEKNPAYLQAAKLGYDFLKKCFDSDGRMFFIVTKDARPIQKRRYYFSETFAAIACAEYYTASGDEEALQLSRKVFDLLLYLYKNPSALKPKFNPETVKMKGLAAPMILLSTAQVLRTHDKEFEGKYDDFISGLMEEILNGGYFRHGHLFENAPPDGGPKGRLINPGHAIEASWFLAIEANRRNDEQALKKALEILDASLNIGWDREYGGLFSFVDYEGRPPEQLEWDMKLWWPHTEAMIATALAWRITKEEKYKIWFEKIEDYSFDKFSDTQYGEWYGYLHRDGSVSNTLKGNLFKGPYHLPRALILLTDILGREDMGQGYFPL